MTLMLRRKLGECVLLRHCGLSDIVITIARTGLRSVRLAIDAPLEYAIIRGELTKDYAPKSPQAPLVALSSQECQAARGAAMKIHVVADSTKERLIRSNLESRRCRPSQMNLAVVTIMEEMRDLCVDTSIIDAFVQRLLRRTPEWFAPQQGDAA